MGIQTENEITYMAFEVKDSMFAIPVKETLGIVQLTQTISNSSMLLGTPNQVKGVVKVEGVLITVIDIVGRIENTGNLIVVLEHMGRHIGILAETAYLVTVSALEIMEDTIIKTKVFIQDDKIYFVLDEREWHKYLEI